MSSKLFQYAVILQPFDEDDTAKLIVEVKTVLAKDANTVTLQAARAIPEAYVEDLDRIEVVVRPF